jgi:hypothetical protein
VNLNDKFNIKLQMNIVEKRRKTLLKDYIKWVKIVCFSLF